jgi:23S rRNA pseudouridine1911/1915/1917 synthase
MSLLMKTNQSTLRISRVNESQFSFEFSDDVPQRLDRFLVDCLPDYSRARIQSFIKSGHVSINQKTANKSGATLQKGMIICVEIPPSIPSQLEPENIPLNIIFENDDLIALDKPSGMVVHPAAGHHKGTLVHAALAHTSDFRGVGGIQRPGIVHRLDKDTSGVIILAKNDRTHQLLSKQFRNRVVKKTYLALVDGHPPTATGRIEAAIGRDPKNRKRMAVTPNHKGRTAISNFRTLQRFAEHTFLEVKPLTGRTHQIRVHMAFIKCPIVGDKVYGRRNPSLPLNRHFLHSYKLVIWIPGDDSPHTFEAKLPVDLQSTLDLIS